MKKERTKMNRICEAEILLPIHEKMNRITTVQECDATNDDSSTKAGNNKLNL